MLIGGRLVVDNSETVSVTGFDYGIDNPVQVDPVVYNSSLHILRGILLKKDLSKVLPNMEIRRSRLTQVLYARHKYKPLNDDNETRVLYYRRKMVGAIQFISQVSGDAINYSMPICLAYFNENTQRSTPFAYDSPLSNMDRITNSEDYVRDRMLEHQGPPERPKWIEFGDWVLHKFGQRQYETFFERIKLVYS